MFRILKTLSILSHKSWGAEFFFENVHPHCVSHVMCQVSHFFWQTVGASRGRVSYQPTPSSFLTLWIFIQTMIAFGLTPPPLKKKFKFICFIIHVSLFKTNKVDSSIKPLQIFNFTKVYTYIRICKNSEILEGVWKWKGNDVLPFFMQSLFRIPVSCWPKLYGFMQTPLPRIWCSPIVMLHLQVYYKSVPVEDI